MSLLTLFTRIVDALLATSMVAIVCLIAAGVFLRYVVGQPLIFSFEASTILFAWIIFVGSAIAYIRRLHISIDLFRARLSPGASLLLEFFHATLVVGVAGYVTFNGFLLAERTKQSVASLGMPMAVLYAALPAGFGIITVTALCRLVVIVAAVRTLRRGEPI